MSSGFSYSKWDNLVVSSSDDDDNKANKFKPTVTKFEQPSAVTIGPNGISIDRKIQSNEKKVKKRKRKKTVKSIKCASKKSKTKAIAIPKLPILSSLIEKWTKNGGIHMSDICNDCSYFWSQTEGEICIYFYVPVQCKAKYSKIAFNINSNSLHFTSNMNWKSIEHQSREMFEIKKIFVSKLKDVQKMENLNEIQNGTESESEMKLENEKPFLDWEMFDIPQTIKNVEKCNEFLADIISHSDLDVFSEDIIHLLLNEKYRILRVCMEKKRINEHQIIEWWDSVFVNDIKIDLKYRIKDRKSDPETMQNIWKRAHEQFRKSVQDIEPREIDISSSNYQESGNNAQANEMFEVD